MATFIDALDKVKIAEGGYVNDPDDKGGETYRGISRVHNPDWRGWVIIDEYKEMYKTIIGLNKKLKENIVLQKEVYSLYKSKYWDPLDLDDLPNQLIAYQIFDMNVNAGRSAAVKCAQRVLNERETGVWTNDLRIKLMNYK